MAKKRRKKKSIGAALKYEVYGILLITISIIALSGEAAVGRALSRLFGLALGKYYFVLALVGVFVGLHVMVKRAWPRGWTNRRTGLLLLLLALVLSSSIAEINQRLEVLDREEMSGAIVLRSLGEQLQGELLSSSSQQVPIREKAISGGYAGALMYSMLFSLFGYYGALIVNFVMYAIALMLITGKSYVELLRFVVKRAVNMFRLLSAKWEKRASRKTSAAAASPAPANVDDAGTIDDDDGYVPPAPKKRKSLFFAWKQEEPEQQAHEPGEEWFVDRENNEPDAKPLWQAEMERPWERSGEEAEISAETAELPSEGLREPDREDDTAPWEEPGDGGPASVIGPDGLGDASEPPPFGEPDEPDLAAGDDVESDGAALFDAPEAEAGTDARLESEALISEQTLAGDPRRPMAGSAAAAEALKPYKMPPFTLLQKPVGLSKGSDAADMYDSRRKLEATLESFGVRAKVLDVVRGPAVTRYEVQPATGVKVSRIVSLTDDIALALAAKDIRMEAPIPGKSAIGIEVPNTEVSVVTMREVMETPAFQNSPSKLSIAFGRDISGQSIVGNLARMPHLLVAGATGSGKSVCINGIITSILYKAKPDEVKFLMIDPKMVELNVYNGIPHLLAPVVTDPRRASLALKKIVVEMEKRYELFSKSATRNIEGYNALMADNPAAVLPYIVVIVDELADLMMVAAGDVEDSIARLAQMARAAGIHLIIATQRPSVDVITGVIKANIPSRIAFGVSSQVDSRTILDMAGAEKLLGRGDMLFLPVGMSKPLRVQGAFLSDAEVEALVTFVRDQGEAEYKEDLVPEVDDDADDGDMALDELFDQAVQIVVEAKQASVSLLQRRLRIGYTRAARLIDQLEAKSIIGPYEGSKPREVLMTLEQFQAGKLSS